MLPLVLLVVAGVVEVAAVARTSLMMMSAAREGVRVAATSPDTDRALDATRAALGPELARGTRVSVRRPPVVGGVAVVQVAGSYRVFAALGGFPVPLEFSATMRVER